MERIHFTHLIDPSLIYLVLGTCLKSTICLSCHTEVPYWGMSWLRWIHWTLISTDWQGLNQITSWTRYIYNLNKQHTFTNDLLRAYIIISKQKYHNFIIDYIYHTGISQQSTITFYFLQITISYGEFKVVNKPVIKNLVNIPNAVFDEEEDPTR